jgi:hypothetical protein
MPPAKIACQTGLDAKEAGGRATQMKKMLSAALAMLPVPICLVLIVASCGSMQSSQVPDQINGMVGQSTEHVLSCMGPPSSAAQVGATEVWAYNSLGPINASTVLSGNQSLVVGSTRTSQESCSVNLTMQDDRVVAANYRSHGKLLAPSLPCYPVLRACVPDPVAVSDAADRTKEAIAYCKELYKDSRLNPLRGVIALDQPPTLEMQSNSARITDVQRPALDVLKSVVEQCRSRMATSNARLAQLIEQVNPHPAEHLTMLYKAEIAIGEYNTYRQQTDDNFRAAVAAVQNR